MKRGPLSGGLASPRRCGGSHRARGPAPTPPPPALDVTPAASAQGRLPAKGLRMNGYSRFTGWRRART